MRPSQAAKFVLIIALVAVVASSFKIADLIVEYNWWKEVEQVNTWMRMLLYSIGSGVGAFIVAFLALWLAHLQGLRFIGRRFWEHRVSSIFVLIGIAFVSLLVASAAIDSWVLMRYAGARGIREAAEAWKDPVFSHTLPFYLFDLPFYSDLLGFVFTLWVLCAIVFWITARVWELVEGIRRPLRSWQNAETFAPDLRDIFLTGVSRAGFVRVMGVILLLIFAVWVLLGNYELLLNSHAFMTGADYVDAKIVLPLRWLLIVLALAGIPLVWSGRYKPVAGMVVAGYVLLFIVPSVVRAGYVRPNEISIERPYIQRHIEATTAAFGLDRRANTKMFPVSDAETVDPAEHATLLDNIRLWDWRAYRDTITQIQALRPYYTFPDADVDRYTIGGRIKQVLLSSREIDVNQLPAEAQRSWVNPHLIYTHGFGAVVAEVNKTTADGLPVLLIANAPPEIRSPGFKLTRPEIYYGEETQDPVFVDTAQEEFDYPSGDQNKYSRYQGNGGFPIDSLPLQIAAAMSFSDSNILFTRYFTAQSRMMIHRNVHERVARLAGFIAWDGDPYLVITDDGKLVWMIDGYTTSQLYPYSASLTVGNDDVNYIRNAVKATVDAYTGKMRMYVFDLSDPIIQAYQNIFPTLFRPASEMPADLRRHARYPETLFRTQAEAFRTFHMRDPQVFYNKEDVWEVPRSLSSQSGKPEPMSPVYVVATLPGESEPEFLLMLPFTPRGKDNLIGWMAARCDGDKLNELVYFQLSKQQLVYGPMQISSRIDQDQNIAKDLTLWNQEGSRVRRGNLIVLPLGEAFLYIESIYIQATEARMPQLKKVVLAIGNRLIYRDTFDEALAELTNGRAIPQRAPTAITASPPSAAPSAPATDQRMAAIADRLRRLHEQAEKLTQEIQAIENEAAPKQGAAK